MPIVGLTKRFDGVFYWFSAIYYNNVAYAYTYAHTRKNRITEPFVNVFNNSTAGKFYSTNQFVNVFNNFTAGKFYRANQSVLVKPNIN